MWVTRDLLDSGADGSGIKEFQLEIMSQKILIGKSDW